MPVNFVSFYDALRFANWLNNGQGNGDTETGAYTLLGGTATPSNATVTRNAGATIFFRARTSGSRRRITTRSAELFRLPGWFEHADFCAAATATPNRANCNARGDLTTVGSYSGSASPTAPSTKAETSAEWNETLEHYVRARLRGIRGGGCGDHPERARCVASEVPPARKSSASVGFRLALIPEPSTGLLVIAGLLGLAGWRRARA